MAQRNAVRTATINPSTVTAQLALALPQDEALPSGNALGFELGWEHARHGLTPPVEQLFTQSPLRQGWQTGRATFGHRALKPTPATRQWLQLRTHAWTRGLAFESTLLTANYLQQLDTAHCPISRDVLTQQAGDAAQKRIARVRDDAGYAAGNLAVISRQAHQAKGHRGWVSAWAIAQSLSRGPLRQMGGLDAASWQRMAVLSSFVTELSHDEAARIPLHVLPPNRLRLFNPIQALQALVTRQLATPGWSQRLARLEALLPTAQQADFNRFVLALVPRVLQAGSLQQSHEIRWALEDAWGHALVQRRWTQFALGLDAAQAEQLVQRAAARQLSPVLVQQHELSNATEGWGLKP